MFQKDRSSLVLISPLSSPAATQTPFSMKPFHSLTLSLQAAAAAQTQILVLRGVRDMDML